MLRLPQDRTRASAFSFPASTSLPLTRKGCLLLSTGDNSRYGPHLPWLSTRPRGRHYKQWGCTCPSLFFATGSFMWLSLGAAHGEASGCWFGVAAGRLWMGPLLAFTPIIWSTARCCSDSSCGYGVFWGLLWTPSFFLGLGLWFRPRGLVGLDCIRLKWGFYIYQTFPP
jgi:hypothetical protein